MNFVDVSKKEAVTLLRFLYAIWALIGMFSLMYVPSKIIVFGDAVATANNILSNVENAFFSITLLPIKL